MRTATRTRFSTRLHPQYIKDSAGSQMVVLSYSEYSSILEEIEDWEDNMLYLQAKNADNRERVPMETAFSEIEKKR